EPGAGRGAAEIAQLLQQGPDRIELARGREVAGGGAGLDQGEEVATQPTLTAAAEGDALAGKRAPVLDHLDLAPQRRVEGQAAEPAGELPLGGREPDRLRGVGHQ